MLLFCGALALVFVFAARHSAGENKAPAPVARAGTHGAAPAHGGPRKPGKPAAHAAAASEEQRMAEVMAALAGHGAADDSIPEQTTADIKFLIKAVAESGLSFKLDSEPRSATDVSEWLLKRWQNAQDPIYSPEALMARTTGFSLVDQLTNRVVFKDGTEQALTTWLQIRLAEHKGLPPPHQNPKPVHAPPRANKKKKAEQAGSVEPKAETPAPPK
jgi:hypothetical protein